MLAPMAAALTASRLLKPGSPVSKPPFGPLASICPLVPPLAEPLLAAALASVDADVFAAAVEDEIRDRCATVLDGILRYRRHPWRRAADDPPVVWREGSTVVRDYGPPGGRPVLFVPSLINRAYVLDLAPRLSLLRALSARGLRPLLVDWDRPGDAERGFDLDAYVAGRLSRAFDAVVALAGPRPAVVGYCMGGLLAVALAQGRPGRIARLALLATPWDFHAGDAAAARRLAAVAEAWAPVLDAWGDVPVDAVQSLFAALDPLLVPRKFSRFAALDPDSVRARDFVAVEDWLNDGVPLAAGVARDCLVGWYGGNTPMTGTWRIAGAPVRPADLALPVLAVIPSQDRIVPPAAALALAAAIPGAECYRPTLGHIGMVVSRRAARTVWPRLGDWLLQP
jgi:polyhydroxyalkanoate synthase